MRATPIRALLCTLLALGLAPAAAQVAKEPAKQRASTALATAVQQWKGDLDGMIERRIIRVLVVPTRTQYWVERGQQSGFEYDFLSAFEQELNKNHKAKNKNVRVHVVFIPTSRDQLGRRLKDGLGDIAAGGLTVTAERDREFDFSAPYASGVKELVVTGLKSPQLASIDDLASKEVFVRKSSSYWSHLEALSERLRKEGKAPIKLVAAPEDLQTDSILEMVNAGLVGITVADRYIGQLWAKVLKNIKPREDLAVSEGGDLAWMIREGSPLLKAELSAFATKNAVGTTFGNSLRKKYTGSTRFVKPATSPEEMKKFERTVDLFRKYGDTYHMDYLLMMAQGYQESRLDQDAKSPVGALGVMQVMPATGKDMATGDVNQIDPNIHAGVKYMRFVQDQFFEKEDMTEVNKTLFAFAAYNCGPGRMNQLRAEARKRGLDANVWFNNVELVAADKIGAETVTYVSNIYKYYIAYKLVTGNLEAEEKAKKDMKKS